LTILIVLARKRKLTAWEMKRSPNHIDRYSAIGITLSNGQVGYISYTISEQVIRLKPTHSAEAWTFAWSGRDDEQRYCFYSGGDDSVLCKTGGSMNHQEREDVVLQVLLNELSRDTKTHSAGVTAILPTMARETGGQQVVITGSYDEHVRVLLLRSGIERSQVLAERRVHGGGVWRLKSLGLEQDSDGTVSIKILASCMHAGTRILEIHRSGSGVWSVQVVAQLLEHGSMNYASDIRTSLPSENPGMTVLSTSFYDRKICFWNFERK